MQRTSDLFERWHHFELWECVMVGVWSSRRNDAAKIEGAKNTLSDPAKCREAMGAAISRWPISAQQHLSKPRSNRRPWMGQSACAMAVGATEEETRLAWNLHMTQDAQRGANAIADELIAVWEKTYA